MSHAAALTDGLIASTEDAERIPTYILACADALANFEPDIKAMPGPPCKLTPALAVRLLSALREGSHYEPACDLAGISYRAFREWMNRAEDEPDGGPFSTLAHAVKVAVAEAEFQTVKEVRKAAKDPRFWAAGMTFLERRHPDRWKRRDDSTVNVNVGVALGVQVSDEQRRAIVPRVDISVLPKGNADRSPLGIEPASAPTFASSASLSPDPLSD